MRNYLKNRVLRLAWSLMWENRLLAFLARMKAASFKAEYFPNAEGLSINPNSVVKYPEKITFGAGCIIGKCTLGGAGGIKFGTGVTVSEGAVIETGTLTRSGEGRHKAAPITIGNGVWVCAGAIILGGVSVPDNTTVPAGAVVRRTAEPRG